MRAPRSRRRRRTHRWEGVVDEVDTDTFWAYLVPTDHPGPELVAQFDLALLPDACPGRVFTLYVHHKGRRYRSVLRAKQVRWARPA